MHRVIHPSFKLTLFVGPNGSSHVSNRFFTWTVLDIHPNPHKQSVFAKCELGRSFNILSLKKALSFPNKMLKIVT